MSYTQHGQHHSSPPRHLPLTSDSELLPFKGPLKLPDKAAVTKLYFWIRDDRRYEKASRTDIAYEVEKHVSIYWNMANIPSKRKDKVKDMILKLVQDYDDRKKSRSKKTKQEEARRSRYLESLQKLFDIARMDAEQVLQSDKLLEAGDRAEDTAFLEDQRGPRRMEIGQEDTKYGKKLRMQKSRNEKRKKAEAKETERKRAEPLTKETTVRLADVDDSESDADFEPPRERETEKKRHSNGGDGPKALDESRNGSYARSRQIHQPPSKPLLLRRHEDGNDRWQTSGP